LSNHITGEIFDCGFCSFIKFLTESLSHFSIFTLSFVNNKVIFSTFEF
jgi:hypothetical protein